MLKLVFGFVPNGIQHPGKLNGGKQSIGKLLQCENLGWRLRWASTLGKIDIQGRDAGTFLNRVYANGFTKLPVGKARYGLMLREDGIVMDDGTTARLGKTHYLMTTTTANAVSVFRHLEFCHQCLWPDLDVHLIVNGTICPICHCRTKFPPLTGKAD